MLYFYRIKQVLKSSISDFRHLWHLQRLSRAAASSSGQLDASESDDSVVYPTFDALPWSHILHAAFSFLLSAQDPVVDLTEPGMLAVCRWARLESFEPPACWSKVAPCSHPEGDWRFCVIFNGETWDFRLAKKIVKDKKKK